jgi:hypothetical protein
LRYDTFHFIAFWNQTLGNGKKDEWRVRLFGRTKGKDFDGKNIRCMIEYDECPATKKIQNSGNSQRTNHYISPFVCLLELVVAVVVVLWIPLETMMMCADHRR